MLACGRTHGRTTKQPTTTPVARARNQPPARRTAPHLAAVSSPTTIIPGVGRVYDRLRPGQGARRRRWRLVGLGGGALVLVILALLVVRAHPWQVTHPRATVASATTASHPTAYGEHDFVCAALPYARLAQAQMTSGTQALVHPWYLSVVLAQWGVEERWTLPGYAGYNWANAPALANFPAIPGANQPGAPTTLAFATTAETGVAIYVATIKGGTYAGVAAAYPAGADAQAVALGQSAWDANHYTDTGHPGSALLDTIHYYHLDRFDQAHATC